MANPLGNPEDQDALTITPVVQEVIVTHGLQSIEFINLGASDVFFGKLSTLTAERGGIIYSNGGTKSFENIPSNWRISFITKTGNSNLRRIDYK